MWFIQIRYALNEWATGQDNIAISYKRIEDLHRQAHEKVKHALTKFKRDSNSLWIQFSEDVYNLGHYRPVNTPQVIATITDFLRLP